MCCGLSLLEVRAQEARVPKVLARVLARALVQERERAQVPGQGQGQVLAREQVPEQGQVQVLAQEQVPEQVLALVLALVLESV